MGQKMIIGFDAKRLFFNSTGLGVYSRNLIKGFTQHFAEHDYLLFANDPQSSRYYRDFDLVPTFSGRGPLWRSWRMTKAILGQRCQLYHGLSHEIPRGLSSKIPTVVTIHDVIFRREPHLFPAVDRWIYQKKWKHSCQYADCIVAVSEHTKKDIVEYFPVAAEKIRVIYPPIDLSFAELKGEYIPASTSFGFPKNYLLYVGAITPRKNLMNIINALGRMPKSDRMALIVVGTGGKYQKEIETRIQTLGINNLVTFLGHVPNQELPYLYKQARCLVYPSFYEGFGMPIVEALACGTPVITSNLSSMPEAAGPGGLLINPKSVDEILVALTRIVQDDHLHTTLAQAGKEHAQQFDLRSVCSKMMQLYQERI